MLYPISGNNRKQDYLRYTACAFLLLITMGNKLQDIAKILLPGLDTGTGIDQLKAEALFHKKSQWLRDLDMDIVAAPLVLCSVLHINVPGRQPSLYVSMVTRRYSYQHSI